MQIVRCALLASLAICLCSCGDIQLGAPSIIMEPPKKPATLDFQWYEDRCGATNTKWYVLNPNNVEWKVEVSEANPSGGNRIRRVYTAKPNTGTFQTGLYIGIERVGSNCFDKDYSLVSAWPSSAGNAAAYRLLKAQERAERKLKFRRADVKPDFQLAPPITWDNASLNCESECKQGTINCLRNTPPTDQVDKVQHYLSTLPNSVTTIDNAALLNIIGQGTNICRRSDVNLLNGRFYNTGSSCSLTFRTTTAEAKPAAALLLNGGVKANYAAAPAASTYRLDFTTTNSMPSLAFSHPGLDADWGGEVLEITSTPSGVFYRTPGGCISVEKRQ